MVTYQKHKHGRVPLFGKIQDDCPMSEVVPFPISTVTQRICNLFRVHNYGQIDDETFTRELRVIQNEFLSPAKP